MDFLQFLETDMVLNIFSCLDDPADLGRASIVSRSWRDFGELQIMSFLILLVLAICYDLFPC